MERDWVRLGKALNAARKAKGLTQPQLGEMAGASRATVAAIEGGKPFARVTPTLRAVERAVGWRGGSVEAVLAGGDPTPALAAVEQEPDTPGPTDDLPLRIVQELGEGPLLDTVVLTVPGSDARMIVVVKGEADASPEQIHRDLRAWRRAQRGLQNLGDSDDDESPVANGA